MSYGFLTEIATILTIFCAIIVVLQFFFGLNNIKELFSVTLSRSGTFSDSPSPITGRAVFTNVDLLDEWGARELEQEVFEEIRHVEKSDPRDRYYVATRAKNWALRNSIIAIHRGKDGLRLFPVFKLPRDWRNFQSWAIKKRLALLILNQQRRLCFVDFKEKEFGTVHVYGETGESSDPIPIQEVWDTNYVSDFAAVFETKIDRVVIAGKVTQLHGSKKKVALYLEDRFIVKVNQAITDIGAFQST